MENNLYYYKRSNGHYVFNDGTILPEREGIMHLINKRKEGHDVHRLYLDYKKDFEFIKEHFFTPEYWEGREWVTEDAESKTSER